MLDGIVSEMLPAEIPLRQRQLICFSIAGQVLHYWSARTVVTMLVGEEEFRSFDVATLSQHITAFSLAAIEGLAAGIQPKKTNAKRKKVRS